MLSELIAKWLNKIMYKEFIKRGPHIYMRSIQKRGIFDPFRERRIKKQLEAAARGPSGHPKAQRSGPVFDQDTGLWVTTTTIDLPDD